MLLYCTTYVWNWIALTVGCNINTYIPGLLNNFSTVIFISKSISTSYVWTLLEGSEFWQFLIWFSWFQPNSLYKSKEWLTNGFTCPTASKIRVMIQLGVNLTFCSQNIIFYQLLLMAATATTANHCSLLRSKNESSVGG